jgi:hypothetical protein
MAFSTASCAESEGVVRLPAQTLTKMDDASLRAMVTAAPTLRSIDLILPSPKPCSAIQSRAIRATLRRSSVPKNSSGKLSLVCIEPTCHDAPPARLSHSRVQMVVGRQACQLRALDCSPGHASSTEQKMASRRR